MNAKTIVLLVMNGIGAIALILFFLRARHLKKVCTASTQGTLRQVIRHAGGSRSGPRLECHFTYEVDGVKYSKAMSVPTRGVMNLSQIAVPTFEVNYNPHRPEEFWIDPYEKRRLGGL